MCKKFVKAKINKKLHPKLHQDFHEWLKIKGCEGVHGSSIPPCLIFGNFDGMAKMRVYRIN